MPGTPTPRPPTSRTPAARVAWALEWTAAAVFVIAVYEVTVGLPVALWPDAPDDRILPLWIAAAALAGFGLAGVRRGVRALLARMWPASSAGAYSTLQAFVSGAAATPFEDALPLLAELLARGSGAGRADVWLADGAGFRRDAGWPRAEDGRVPDLGALADAPRVTHVLPVSDAGEVLGALTLDVSPRRLFPPDLRLAADVANAAGLVLRAADLDARLRERIREEAQQAEDLRLSRLRVVAARDAAREQLGHEIQTQVCEPLEALAARMAELHGGDGGLGAPAETVSTAGGAAPGTGAGTPELRAALPELTGHIDTAISRFRSIVRGVYPSVLTDHGLGAALENLAEAVERPTLLRCTDLPRFGARVEAGIYFCLAALLRGWPSTSRERVRITLTVEDGELRSTVWDPAVHEMSAAVDPVVLETALDRIAALDGRFEAVGSASGLVLAIRVPEAAR